MVAILGAAGYVWDYNRTKICFYKDYVEQWGIPQGIGELSSGEQSHAARAYRFEYKKHKLQRVSHVNSKGNIIEDGESVAREGDGPQRQGALCESLQREAQHHVVPVRRRARNGAPHRCADGQLWTHARIERQRTTRAHFALVARI